MDVFEVPVDATGLKIVYDFGVVTDFWQIFSFFKSKLAVWDLGKGGSGYRDRGLYVS
ncbi:hypothetical protein [Archaeoglobus sulfaticallidus]|uniref:hypothetical protein n=1 Tax=Archaeoglobus sulfaticallidus TaxID=1316941 RepID=UPI000AF35C1B|nr:hypothetical protein [Archaeoglobus sulfaticallidus]